MLGDPAGPRRHHVPVVLTADGHVSRVLPPESKGKWPTACMKRAPCSSLLEPVSAPSQVTLGGTGAAPDKQGLTSANQRACPKEEFHTKHVQEQGGHGRLFVVHI